MTERNRAAAHIKFIRRYSEFLLQRERHHRKRFVYFPQINVRHLPTSSGEGRLGGLHRSRCKPQGILGLTAKRNDARDGLQTTRLRQGRGREYKCRGPIVKTRSIRRGNRAVFLKSGLQGGDFIVLNPCRTFVLIHKRDVALGITEFDGRNFSNKLPRLLRSIGALKARNGEGILLRPGEFIFGRTLLRTIPHMNIVIGIPQPIRDY